MEDNQVVIEFSDGIPAHVDWEFFSIIIQRFIEASEACGADAANVREVTMTVEGPGGAERSYRIWRSVVECPTYH